MQHLYSVSISGESGFVQGFPEIVCHSHITISISVRRVASEPAALGGEEIGRACALSAERCARALLIPDHFLNIQERHDYASNRPANGRRGQVTRRVLEDGQNQVQQMRLYLVCLLL